METQAGQGSRCKAWDRTTLACKTPNPWVPQYRPHCGLTVGRESSPQREECTKFSYIFQCLQDHPQHRGFPIGKDAQLVCNSYCQLGGFSRPLSPISPPFHHLLFTLPPPSRKEKKNFLKGSPQRNFSVLFENQGKYHKNLMKNRNNNLGESHLTANADQEVIKTGVSSVLLVT